MPDLTPDEIAILHDRRFLPMKWMTLAKIESMLAHLRDNIARELAPVHQLFPPEFDVQTGKLSKGDNYNYFPYRVLDYPRAFDGPDIFTYRALVLWGHHISFHLIMAGRWKSQFQESLVRYAAELPEAMQLSRQAKPWIWEFDESQYLPARSMSSPEVAQALRNSDFVKISFFMPLRHYADLATTGTEIWRVWQMVLLS